MYQKTTGITHLINSTKYSIKGFKSAVKYEAAFRQELFLGLLVIPLAFWIAKTNIELFILLGSYLLLLLIELLNSAIEAVVDRIGTEHHELSGRAKDLGSAAVFIAISMNVLAWGVILLF